MFCDQQQYHSRLALIDGFARQYNVNGTNGVLPMAVNAIVRNYADDVAYWTLHGDTLSDLLCNTNNYRVVNDSVYRIEGVAFKLSVQNKNGNLLFQVMILQNEEDEQQAYSKPFEYEFVYVELYCIQTQTQFKHTFEPFIERHGNKSYSAISWSDNHLNVAQCANKQQLTFSVYLKPLLMSNNNPCAMLDESSYAQYQYEYQWNLTQYKQIDSNQRCKVYSPNFTDRDNTCCWCLWYEPLPVASNADVRSSNDASTSICIGLQLLNLPPNLMKKGILFQCSMEYQVTLSEHKRVQNEYTFTYFLNLFQNVVTIKNFSLDQISWIKVRINPIVVHDDEETDDDGDEQEEETFMETIQDYQYVANLNENCKKQQVHSTYSPISTDQDWFMMVTHRDEQTVQQLTPSVYLLDVSQDWNFRV